MKQRDSVYRVLFVEEEGLGQPRLDGILNLTENTQYVRAGSLREARALLQSQRFDVVIADESRLRRVIDSIFTFVGLFSALDAPISLAFLARFSTQDALDKLTGARLAGWLTRQRYPGRTSAATLLERIRTAPRGPVGESAAGLGEITRALLAVLASLSASRTDSLLASGDDRLTAHAE